MMYTERSCLSYNQCWWRHDPVACLMLEVMQKYSCRWKSFNLNMRHDLNHDKWHVLWSLFEISTIFFLWVLNNNAMYFLEPRLSFASHHLRSFLYNLKGIYLFLFLSLSSSCSFLSLLCSSLLLVSHLDWHSQHIKPSPFF